MGWSKYNEDIIRTRDENFYKRDDNPFINLKSKKINNKTNSNLVSEEDKFIDIKTTLIQVKTWKDFFIDLSEIVYSNTLKQYLNFRLEQLNNIEDNYYNEYYKEQYKSKRSKVKINNKSISKDFLERVKIDFIYILCNLFTTLRNKSVDDSIELSNYYLDIKDYYNRIMNKNLEEPYIKNILTLIDFDYEEEVCPLCKKKTYKNANICIFCNFDRGE